MSETLLGGKDYLLGGDKPSVADLYAAVILSWSGYVGVDFAKYANLAAFSARVEGLPVIAEARAEMQAAA